jgi:hypothetical protein
LDIGAIAEAFRQLHCRPPTAWMQALGLRGLKPF